MGYRLSWEEHVWDVLVRVEGLVSVYRKGLGAASQSLLPCANSEEQTLVLQICQGLDQKVKGFHPAGCKPCVCVVCKLASLRHFVLAGGLD